MEYRIRVMPILRLLMVVVGMLSFQFVHSRVFGGINDDVVIQNDFVLYQFGTDGINRCFIDKSTGKDYLAKGADSPIAIAWKEGQALSATKVVVGTNRMTIYFGSEDAHVTVRTRSYHDHFNFQVEHSAEGISELDFLNIPLDLEAMPNEPFAACALAMNLQTQVPQLPVLQTHLQARCFSQFGIEGAEVTFFGAPQQEALPVVRKIMSTAEDIPKSTSGGAWAQLSKEGYGSYLMNFGDLTEENVDEWISYCRSVGFNQIDHHGGRLDFFRFGDLDLEADKWPEGWIQFKRINDKLHDAGISSIFHTYAFFIDKHSRYVTPIPSPDLGYVGSFTLAQPISPTDTVIEVLESTALVSTHTGFHFPNSRTLRIGNELIEFSGVTAEPPYRFTGCKRGVNGTEADQHQNAGKAYHLKELFGRFVPGPETPLFTEIAKRTAAIVNQCGFDGIYFDAIDGSDILDGANHAWYYGTKFVFEVARNLDTPVGMEMSTMSHHWWHYRSRWQAWDVPRRGYKRFIDIHAAALKSHEIEHGYWRGHSAQLEHYAALKNGKLMLPLQLGWWHHFTFDPPNTEHLFPDDIEYLGCKMIGNNAGLAMSTGYTKAEVEANPSFVRLNALLKQYEALRHQDYFDESVKKELRMPGKEFVLFQEPDGRWNFRRMSYDGHKVDRTENHRTEIISENPFQKQPLKLRIQSLMAVKPYDHPDAIQLTSYDNPNDFHKIVEADGVFGRISGTGQENPTYGHTAYFSAYSAGIAPKKGTWVNFEKKFEPWLDLSGNQALGVWIKGDGKGQLLNLRLETPEHLSAGVRGDHYVDIDFTGWRYFELVEIESNRFSDYLWPGAEAIPGTKVKDLFLYKSYLHSVLFDKVDRLQLWYNNLADGEESTIEISEIRALPMVPYRLKNPSIELNGRKITFPVEIESGMYLEFNAIDDCKLYGKKGEFIKNVLPSGEVPSLDSGTNTIQFKHDTSSDINARLALTIITAGDQLLPPSIK